MIDIKYNIPEDNKGVNAVVYARYSSHNQGEQSIEGQLSAAKTYAEAKGYTIIKEYIDRAMTGRNDNRDQFQKMLSDCQTKQFQVIIVWKVDRFGRNRQEITFNKYRAKKYGVKVEYVAENLPDSPEGVILESVLEGMAEYYSLQLSQNITRGLKENAKKGKYCGGHISYGYKLDAERRYIIDEKTAPVVKRIFKMYAEGQTIPEIAEILNGEGLRSGYGKEFNKNNLRSILHNRKYIGEFIYKRGTPEEIVVENAMPVLIDVETFDKAQEMLKRNNRAPAHRWSKNDYILTDKLFCGSCGGAMAGESGRNRSGKKYHYYLCTNHKRKKGCNKKAVRAEAIEAAVINEATRIILDDEMIEFIAESVWKYYCSQDQTRDQIEGVERQLKDVDNAIIRLMKAIEAGVEVNDIMTNRITELNNQKTALEKALAESKLDRGFKLTKDHILFFLSQFKNMNFKDRECQKRLINVFVNSIYVTDDEFILNFNFSGDRSIVSLSDIKELKNGGVFEFRALSSTRTRTAEHFYFYKNVFAIKKTLIL